MLNVKTKKMIIVKGVFLPVISVIRLPRCRMLPVSGKSIHFKEEMHHVDEISSICARNFNVSQFFGNTRVI